LDVQGAADIVLGREDHGIAYIKTYIEKVPLEVAVYGNGTFDIGRAGLATLRAEARDPLAEAVLAIASNSCGKLLT